MFSYFFLFLGLICLSSAQILPCIGELMQGPELYDGILCSDLNVLVFSTFQSAPSGDVQGRLAAQSDISLGYYSIGDKLQTGGNGSTDNSRDYSLLCGGNLSWKGGSLYPDGTGSSKKENMFVAGNLNVPSYLVNRRTGGPCNGCLNGYFANVKSYYTSLSSNWASQTPNVAIQLKYGNGLFITGNDPNAPRYYIQVDVSIFNQVTWYTLININVTADFIITITGSQDVQFQGGYFPGSYGSIAYNIPGSRNINVGTGVGGSILSPFGTLNQPVGVIDGFVIVGSATNILQINKLNCRPACHWVCV